MRCAVVAAQRGSTTTGQTTRCGVGCAGPSNTISGTPIAPKCTGGPDDRARSVARPFDYSRSLVRVRAVRKQVVPRAARAALRVDLYDLWHVHGDHEAGGLARIA